ncbi:DUF2061 domain-containing protein [Fodinicurvata fenggangensis]|uniref:DUF2061 domain-containing protein n=1 Tax=Fodinicurvata fenggangensis TaxID=1121830 RepID=UPI000478ABEE|nr:DUF2061 domain-containing protein [Fodinicurvata fenggangensis]
MKRDLAKTLSYGFFHILVGFSIAFALTGSLAIASGIALIEPLANTVLYFFHERVWKRLGRRQEMQREGLTGQHTRAHA